MKRNEEKNQPTRPGRSEEVNRKENILSQQRNDRSATGTNNEEEGSDNTFVGTPGEIGTASLGGSYDDERLGGTSGRGGNDGSSMSIRSDSAPHVNNHGTNPHQTRGNQGSNTSQGSNPSGNNERG